MGFFKYKVEFYNEAEEKSEEAYGIVSGSDFREAMENLDDYYKDSLETILWLGQIYDCSAFEVTDEVWSKLDEKAVW